MQGSARGSSEISIDWLEPAFYHFQLQVVLVPFQSKGIAKAHHNTVDSYYLLLSTFLNRLVPIWIFRGEAEEKLDVNSHHLQGRNMAEMVVPDAGGAVAGPPPKERTCSCLPAPKAKEDKEGEKLSLGSVRRLRAGLHP